jgi:hypothetical protein
MHANMYKATQKKTIVAVFVWYKRLDVPDRTNSGQIMGCLYEKG